MLAVCFQSLVLPVLSIHHPDLYLDVQMAPSLCVSLCVQISHPNDSRILLLSTHLMLVGSEVFKY